MAQGILEFNIGDKPNKQLKQKYWYKETSFCGIKGYLFANNNCGNVIDRISITNGMFGVKAAKYKKFPISEPDYNRFIQTIEKKYRIKFENDKYSNGLITEVNGIEYHIDLFKYKGNHYVTFSISDVVKERESDAEYRREKEQEFKNWYKTRPISTSKKTLKGFSIGDNPAYLNLPSGILNDEDVDFLTVGGINGRLFYMTKNSKIYHICFMCSGSNWGFDLRCYKPELDRFIKGVRIRYGITAQKKIIYNDKFTITQVIDNIKYSIETYKGEDNRYFVKFVLSDYSIEKEKERLKAKRKLQQQQRINNDF